MSAFESVPAFALVVAQSFSLLLPITLGGITLIICMRKGWLAALDIPLDGGLTLGGRPLIGRSKSVRSLVLYLVVASLTTLGLHFAAILSDLVAPVFRQNPFIFASATTLAYLAGEVLNSFVKRRLGVETSAQSKKRGWAFAQKTFDNIDGMLASGLVLIFGYGVPTELLIGSFILANITHLSTDALMRRLRLKRKQQ